MSSHVSTYELTATRTAAGGSNRPDATYLHTSTDQATTDDQETDPIEAPFPVPFSGYGTDKHPTRSVRIQVITGNASDLMVLEGLVEPGGPDFWQVNGVPTDNGTAIANVFGTTDQLPSGRVTPRMIFQFGGDVLIAIRALASSVTGYKITTLNQYHTTTLYQGQAHLCEFEEVPTATALVSNRAGQLLAQLASGGNQATLGQLVNGTTIKVPNCVLAALAPEGAVYVAPEDFGTGNDQIPASVAANTAAKFRFHPSVFVRRGAYWNSVTRRQYDGISLVATQQGMPVRVINVDNPITQSAWLIGIDGVMSVFYVQHGGVDLRRPRDIWEQIWLPIIQGATSVRDSVSTGVGANIVAVGQLSRFAYLEYARCLPLPGIEVPQTEISAS